MTETRSDVRDAIAQFHEDIPHQFRVSLTMSIDARDDLSAVRDELNDIAGNRDVTTNDVVRLALIAAARYHSLATDDEANLDAVDQDQLVPLTGVLRRVIDDERIVDPSDETTE